MQLPGELTRDVSRIREVFAKGRPNETLVALLECKVQGLYLGWLLLANNFEIIRYPITALAIYELFPGLSSKEFRSIGQMKQISEGRLLKSLNTSAGHFKSADRVFDAEESACETVALPFEKDAEARLEGFVGASPAIQDVLSRVSKVALTESTVLLLGETGTGKELIARAIHQSSARSGQAFVAVNCAAIPGPLIASELFGHERGAFTGALQRRLGRFELAHGGTLFFDEIGELPVDIQIMLLRVLQEREFERVGGTQSIRANVRLIAATNRNLREEIVTGRFRADLFFRLNVFEIDIPPLRARKRDIPLLTEYFVHRLSPRFGKTIKKISRQTVEIFESYAWPGNVRELQNLVERSLILCDSETFSVDESWVTTEFSDCRNSIQPLSEKLAADEKSLIEAALADAGGKVAGSFGAAARLGLAVSTLESKIRALRINKHKFKNYQFGAESRNLAGASLQ
jgi:formate hydrogenlyase transcriptional activator